MLLVQVLTIVLIKDPNCPRKEAPPQPFCADLQAVGAFGRPQHRDGACVGVPGIPNALHGPGQGSCDVNVL